MNSKPRLLVLDIETSPNVTYTWGLWNVNISINQIQEQGRILCYAARWVGEKEILFSSEHHNSRKEMLESLWDLLDESDAIIGFNSQAFDCKWINAEFLKEGYMPPSPYNHIDLLKEVRKNFKHPSNKLDYIAQRLDIGAKVEHYGFQLWRDVMAGDKKGWAVMKRYNKGDVKLTEELYEILKPWLNTKVNFGLFADAETPTCKNCGSTDLELLDKMHYTKTQTYHQYRCNECGTVSRERTRSVKQPQGVLT